MRSLVACVSLLVFALPFQSTAAEREKPTSNATGVIKLVPLGIDGKPIAKNSDILWRKITPDVATKGVWHDSKTDTWWDQVTGFSTSGNSTFNKLEPGTYRVTIRDGHDATGAIGIGEPIVIDAKHQSASTEVRLAEGATLHLTCIDAKTGHSIPPPFLELRVVEGEVPLYWQYRADPVAAHAGEFEFQHLRPGQYRLKAKREARNPIDSKHELQEGEITIKVDGTQTISRELKFTTSPLTKEEIERDWPFVVFGRVSDKAGQPIADAVVAAHTGNGTMFQSGATTTGADGRFRLYFAEGGLIHSSGITLAIISASMPGLSDTNLGRQGEFTAAYEQPPAGVLAEELAKNPLLLAHKPVEINFTLAPVGALNIRIHRDDRDDRSGIRVSLKGATMPPGCNVIDSGTTDRWGEVKFAKVPLDREWWVEVENFDKAIRTQSFKLTDPQRYELTLDWRTDATGAQLLDIKSLTDALDIDRTLELVGDDRTVPRVGEINNQRADR